MLSSLKQIKKNQVVSKQSKGVEELIKKQLNVASGIREDRNVDPISCITEDFKQSFEENLLQKKGALNESKESGPEIRLGESSKHPSDNDFYNRFIENSLNNGNLVSGILNENSKNIFVSILKRSLNNESYSNDETKKLFSKSEKSYPVDNLPIHLELNRYTNETIGIVLDTLMSANKVVSSFSELINGKADGTLGKEQKENLFKMYPFLCTEKEEALLEGYKQKLEEVKENALETKDHLETQNVLAHGINKTTALIHKKHQMKIDFMTVVNEILNKSEKAKKVFSEVNFVSEVVQELEEFIEEHNSEDDSETNNEENNEENNEANSQINNFWGLI